MWLAKPAHWYGRHQTLKGLVDVASRVHAAALGHVRHETASKGVSGDPVRAILDGDVTDKGLDGCLGRAVRAHADGQP